MLKPAFPNLNDLNSSVIYADVKANIYIKQQEIKDLMTVDLMTKRSDDKSYLLIVLRMMLET